MENLIDLIYMEFEREGYNSENRLLWKHRTFKDYWVVCYVEGDYDLHNMQQWVLKETAEERAQEPEMEKNTSLLIVNKVEEGKVNQERIIADENNVYYFKKYVLQYTEEEWEKIKGLFIGGSTLIGDLLMRAELFEEVKKDRDCPESLLYRIAHKLPFASLSVSKKAYDLPEGLSVSDELADVLQWVDNIPMWEGKNPNEREMNNVINAVKGLVENEIAEHHENREDQTA